MIVTTSSRIKRWRPREIDIGGLYDLRQIPNRSASANLSNSNHARTANVAAAYVVHSGSVISSSRKTKSDTPKSTYRKMATTPFRCARFNQKSFLVFGSFACSYDQMVAATSSRSTSSKLEDWKWV